MTLAKLKIENIGPTVRASKTMPHLKLDRNFYVANILPPGSAILDFASGIIAIGEAREDVLAALEMGSDLDESSRMRILETLSHEIFHVQQAVLSGWLFDFTSDWHAKVRQLMPRAEDHRDYVLEDLGSKQKVLEDFLQVLHSKNESDISVFELIEGHAYIAQKLTHYRGTRSTLLSEFEKAVHNESYWRAFDYARKHLGTNALDLFPGLAYTALCTKYPASAFRHLCKEAAKKTAIPSRNYFLELLDRLVRRGVVKVLGSGIERYCARKNSGQASHPVFELIAHQLNRGRAFDPFRVMGSPQFTDAECVSNFIVPIQAQGGTIVFKEQWLEPMTFILPAILKISQRILAGHEGAVWKFVDPAR